MEEFEILFYKVIHNKFLFNLIFDKIHSVDWIEYDSITNIHIDNRKKFKDIVSMEWMVEKELYELLKCKLEHNEFIEIKKQSLVSLLYKDSTDKIPTQISNKQDIKIQILVLLLEKKRDTLCNFDLPFIALDNNNLTAFDLLINEPYSLPIYPSTLKHAIEFSEPLFVERIINTIKSNNNKNNNSSDIKSPTPSIITDKIKNTSIWLAFYFNENYKEEMMQYILNTPELYDNSLSSSNSPLLSDLETYPSKKYKSSKNPSENHKHKLEITDLFKIKSTQIQTKLLDLNYFKPFSGEDDDSSDSDSSDSDSNDSGSSDSEISYDIEDEDIEVQLTECKNETKLLDFYESKSESEYESESESESEESEYDSPDPKLFNIKINNIISSKSELIGSDGSDNRFKELLKLFAIKDMDYYKKYLKLFDEEIDGLDLMVSIKHCLSKFSVKIFNYLLSNNYIFNFIKFKKKIIKKMKLEISQNQPPPTNEFILLYCSNSYIENEYCNKHIISKITSIKSSNEYELLINEINSKASDSSSLKNLLPLKWNPILNIGEATIDKDGKCNIDGGLIIQDKESIDWLFDNIKTSKWVKKMLKNWIEFGLIQIGTRELVDYSIIKSKSLNSRAVLTKSMKTKLNYYVSIKEIKESLKSTQEEGKTPNLDIDLFKSLPQETILEFNNYIDSNNEILLTQILVDSILNFSPAMIEFILNKSNPINTYPELLVNKLKSRYQFSVFILYKKDANNKTLKYRFISNSPIDVTKCIQILIKSYIKNNNKDNTSSRCSDGTKLIYQKILNYLFKRLLQCKGITIQQVKECYHLITASQFIIKNTIYHSFYYIGIKSIKFQKYIMGLPGIGSIIEFDNIGYRLKTHKSMPFDGYKISKFLDPSIFTFEYIFGIGTSFDSILDKLITHLSILPSIQDPILIVKNKNHYELSLNYNLFYLLEIRRVDLFFKLLNQIQVQLEVSSSKKASRFKISSEVYTNAFKLLDNELEFQKFISFDSYYSIRNFFEIDFFDQIDTQVIIGNRNIDLLDYIYRNHLNKPIYRLIWGSMHSKKYLNLPTFQLVNKIIELLKNNQLDKTNKDQLQSILLEILEDSSDDIASYNLILPINQNQGITKKTIKAAISRDHIGFIKYYYENGLIKDKTYTKKKLSSHTNFKYFTWLNK